MLFRFCLCSIPKSVYSSFNASIIPRRPLALRQLELKPGSGKKCHAPLKKGRILLLAGSLLSASSAKLNAPTPAKPLPTIDLSKNASVPLNWNRILLFLYEDIIPILSAVAAAVISAFINVKIPLLLGDVINVIAEAFRNDGSVRLTSNLTSPALLLLAYSISQALTTFVYISLLSLIGERLAVKIRLNLFSAIMRQDISFFDNTRTSVLVDCITSDVQEFKSTFKLCISQGLKNCTQIVGSSISLFLISSKISIIVMSIVPLIIFVGALCGARLRTLSKRAQNQSLAAATLCEEKISNIRTVRAFGAEESEYDSYQELLLEAGRLNVLLGYGIGAFQAGTNIFLNGMVLGTVCIGGRLMIQNEITAGNLMSFLVAVQVIQRSFAQLSLLFGHIFKGKEASHRIFKLSNSVSRIPIKGGVIMTDDEFTPSVDFKKVSFSYPTRPEQMILNELDLSIPAGKTAAIVGSSGNGKSTIVALLERFYEVEDGEILIGGVNIKELDPQWLRGRVIGFISQEPVLFATSVMENIRYGKPDASDEEVYNAARFANADSFINGFPDGYHTMLGERGVNISGGQKQRIAIARALIKNPSILILDEATSALDSESEAIVQATLEEVSKNRTVLTIAHRLSTVKNASTIIVLDKGVIKERGTHDELIMKKGAYYSLMNQEERKTGDSRTL